MKNVLVEPSDSGVTVLSLNRPDRRNALDHALVSELHAALDEVAGDRSCRVVILTGVGAGFCAGYDLADAGFAPGAEGADVPTAGMLQQQHIARLIPRMRSIPQPIIAAVNGAAVGGGLALALGADIRVAGRSATFSVANVKVGLSGCDVGISYLLPRMVGASVAFELMLTGRSFGPEDAARYGLVSRVVPDDELLDSAQHLAGQIVANSAFGIWMTKEVMWANLEITSLQAAIDLEDRTQVLATFTGALEQARAAFRAR